MPKRRRLATGIYADAYGISVVYHVGGVPQPEARFPRGANLDRLVRWRNRQIAQQRELRPAVHQLARDVARYLKAHKGRPGYKSEKSHLRAWLQALPVTTRRAVKPQHCETIVSEWQQQGYAARTIRHRIRAFKALYQKFDGKKAITPLDEVDVPRKPRPRPVSVSDATIESVALELRKREILRTLRDAKTRARYLVRMTHSQRPIEFMRAEPIDVDLERRLWFVRGAKGGYNVVVPLNDEQLAAWQLYRQAQAWGPYDTRSFAKTLRRCGWPKGIRPYNLRHSTGFALDARGVDLGDIQGLMGHASPETTRAFYAPGLISRLAAATEKLQGRFSGEAFLPRPSLPRSARADAKEREFTRQIKGSPRRRSRDRRRRDTEKSGNS